MMSTAFSTAGDAMNYVEDTISEELEKTALKGLGRAISKHKRPIIGATVGVPVLAALAYSAREADRKAGGFPQALDDTLDKVDSGLDELDRVIDEGPSNKQKALAALGALGLVGAGGYGIYRGLKGQDKVAFITRALPKMTPIEGAILTGILGTLAVPTGIEINKYLEMQKKKKNEKEPEALNH